MSLTTPSDEISITQKLSLKYDSIFNQILDENNSLDRQNHLYEDLVRRLNQDNDTMDRKNSALMWIVIAVFAILLVILFRRVGFVPSETILGGIVLFILLVTVFIVYPLWYPGDEEKRLARLNAKTDKDLSKEKKPLGNELECEYEEKEDGSYTVGDVSEVDAIPNSGFDKLLKTDSNYNVWLDGNHIENHDYRYIDSNGSSDVLGTFGPISPESATYYDCKYVGASTNGMPIQKDYEKTAIPCNYYINYKETGRYVKNGNNFVKI